MENNLIESCGALIYARTTQRYLFLLRSTSKYRNSWGLVGGKVEPGETVIQGLHREIQEELGGQIDNAKIRPIEKFTSENGNFCYHTFVIVIDDEFVPDLNHEHDGYCWVPLDKYPKPLHPGVWRTFKFEAVINKIKVIEKLANA
jgi:8-oxo-dGTP pyrophosphatase MutT (NUDIX family)